GAGWEATGSESVQARQLVDKNVKGLGSYGQLGVGHSPAKTGSDPAFPRALRGVTATLRSDPSVATVVAPRAGVSIAPDCHAAVCRARAPCRQRAIARR